MNFLNPSIESGGVLIEMVISVALFLIMSGAILDLSGSLKEKLVLADGVSMVSRYAQLYQDIEIAEEGEYTLEDFENDVLSLTNEWLANNNLDQTNYDIIIKPLRLDYQNSQRIDSLLYFSLKKKNSEKILLWESPIRPCASNTIRINILNPDELTDDDEYYLQDFNSYNKIC